MISLRTKALKFALKTIEPFQDRLNRIYLFKKAFQLLYDKFVPDKWILVEVEGVKMYVNTRDRAISRFILQQGCYEKGTTKVFKNVVKQGMTVVDIGAHWGYYSLIAANLGAKVFAFEPHPFNYELFVKSISKNRLDNNIFPINKAVSNKTGKAKLFCSSSNVGGHSLVNQNNGEYIVEVETITLDDFCKENQILPDVVKMDIEGAEVLALEGMKETIKRSRSMRMFVEFERNKEELYEYLKQYFDVFRITKNGRLIPFNEAKEGNFEPNVYCMRK